MHILYVHAQALLEVVTTGPVGTHPLVGHTPADSTLLFTPDASLPDAFYYQSTVFEWNNPADPSVNRILLRSPAGIARLEFDNASSDVKAANDSVLQAVAPAQPAGTMSPQLAGGAPRRARVLLTLNGASENFVGETPYAYHAEPEVTLVLPAGAPAGGDRVETAGVPCLTTPPRVPARWLAKAPLASPGRGA